MAHVLMVGGGIVGSTAAMMLAKDGHTVTVLERDPQPPCPSSEAWTEWQRRGVNQFRLLHYLLARFRQVAEEEVPEVLDAAVSEGAFRSNLMEVLPEFVTGGVRDGDERFTVVTGRRPMMEAVVAQVCQTTDGVEVRRGVGVRGLLHTDGADGIPHVTGVVTDEGDEIRADLVVDSGGRRTAVPRWLREIGSPGPDEMVADCGFVYYGRHFRSSDGSVPPAFGGMLQHYGSVSVLTLPADNGTWGLGIVASARDTVMRRLADVDRWEAVWRSFPLVAHWLDGEPISDIAVMAKIEDRERTYVRDGAPVVTGLVPLADAWACTNPSLGRGISIGLMHAQVLRDALRERGVGDARGFVDRFHALTAERVKPFLDDTLGFDRHRLAETEAIVEGRPYETDDPAWLLGRALERSAAQDPDLLRGFASIGMLLERGVDVMARPGVAERALQLAGEPPPGPDRRQLLELVTA